MRAVEKPLANWSALHQELGESVGVESGIAHADLPIRSVISENASAQSKRVDADEVRSSLREQGALIASSEM